MRNYGSSKSSNDGIASPIYEGFNLGRIPSARSGVTRVEQNDSVNKAITKMLVNNYSQLAVMQGKYKMVGAVSWQSIGHARQADPNATLEDATERAMSYSLSRELIDVVAELHTKDFVFVHDKAEHLCGIVTATDLMKEFGEVANPILLLGEIDHLFRDVIEHEFEISEVRAFVDPDAKRKIASFDDLNFGDYAWLLENPANWDRLDWKLDRVEFWTAIDEVRQIRNALMHFNFSGHAVDVGKLRSMVKLLRRFLSKMKPA